MTFDKKLMAMFKQWIKWMPKGQLSCLTPITFAFDKNISIEQANEFFNYLVKHEYTKPVPRIKCDICGDIVTFTDKHGDTYSCECGNSLTLNSKDIYDFIYPVNKEDFTMINNH